MKKVLKNVSFVILLLKICVIFGQETDTQKRIVIDVGHGGKDSGTIGINGIKEKDFILWCSYSCNFGYLVKENTD